MTDVLHDRQTSCSLTDEKLRTSETRDADALRRELEDLRRRQKTDCDAKEAEHQRATGERDKVRQELERLQEQVKARVREEAALCAKISQVKQDIDDMRARHQLEVARTQERHQRRTKQLERQRLFVQSEAHDLGLAKQKVVDQSDKARQRIQSLEVALRSDPSFRLLTPPLRVKWHCCLYARVLGKVTWVCRVMLEPTSDPQCTLTLPTPALRST